MPVYLILNRLGWLDTPLALIVPAGAGAFGVFLLHQFFLGIPRELEEAAALDGCSPFGIYWQIILPLSRPVLATLAIFTFVGLRAPIFPLASSGSILPIIACTSRSLIGTGGLPGAAPTKSPTPAVSRNTYKIW